MAYLLRWCYDFDLGCGAMPQTRAEICKSFEGIMNAIHQGLVSLHCKKDTLCFDAIGVYLRLREYLPDNTRDQWFISHWLEENHTILFPRGGTLILEASDPALRVQERVFARCAPIDITSGGESHQRFVCLLVKRLEFRLIIIPFADIFFLVGIIHIIVQRADIIHEGTAGILPVNAVEDWFTFRNHVRASSTLHERL